jgi:hypothetical protein
MNTLSLRSPRTAQHLVAAIAIAVVVTLAVVVSLVRLAGGTDSRAPSISRLVPSQSFDACQLGRPC